VFKYTFKLHEMIAKWISTGFDKLIERSWQRKANKQFKNSKKK
jgi:hypothetical protein